MQRAHAGGDRRRARAAILVLAVSFLPCLPVDAFAAWTEGNRRILTLNELLPRLNAVLNRPVGLEVDPESAILIGDDGDLDALPALRSALLESGVRLDEEADRGTIRPALPLSERARALTRMIPASPVAPAPASPGAVTTGGVAFFGILTQPPYRVELVGEAIEINGVAVFPSPGCLTPPPQPSARVVETFDRMQAARLDYERSRGVLGKQRADAALVAALQQIPGFVRVEWMSDDVVRITRQDGIEEHMGFASMRPADPDSEQTQRQYLEDQVSIFRQVLQENGTLLCGATYLIPVQEIPADEFRRRIEEITTSPEREDLKLARIQAYTGDRDAAADLLFTR